MKLPQDIQNSLTTSLGMDDNYCCQRHPNQVICISAARPSKFRRIITSCRICTSEFQAGKCCRQRRSLVPVIHDLQKLQANDQEWKKRTSLLYHWNSALRLVSDDEDESSTTSETTEEDIVTSEPIISDDDWKEQVHQRMHQVRQWEHHEAETAKARRDEIWSKYYKLKSAIDRVSMAFANYNGLDTIKEHNNEDSKDSSLKSSEEDNILQDLFIALRRTSGTSTSSSRTTKKQRSSSTKDKVKTDDKKKKRRRRKKKKQTSQETSSKTKTSSSTTTTTTRRRKRKNRRSKTTKRKPNLDKTFLRSTFQQRVKKLIIINRFFQKIAMKALLAEIQMDIKSYKRNNPKESTTQPPVMVHWSNDTSTTTSNDDGEGGDLVLSIIEFERNPESLKKELFYTNEEIKLFRFEKFMEDHADEFELVEDDDDDDDYEDEDEDEDENDTDYEEEDEYEEEIIEYDEYDEDEYEEYIEEEYDEFDVVFLEESIESKPSYLAPIAAMSA